MIEEIVKDYLDSELNVDVYLEVPREGSTFVVMEKTGSSKQDHVCTATIAVQSYAGTLFDAAQLNEAVKAAMENIINLDVICACSLNSDYNFTDVETKRYRYQAVFDLTHY